MNECLGAPKLEEPSVAFLTAYDANLGRIGSTNVEVT